jgi:uncharacterized membrane protein YphA (DoxX/SURF4 family)
MTGIDGGLAGHPRQHSLPPPSAGRRQAVLPWVSTAARLVLAAVFFASGGLKVADPGQSVRAVQAYELLPLEVARIVGYALPFAEIALAVLLLLGLATRLAAAGSALLLLVFIGGVSSAWARGLSIDCGCFGGGGAVSAGQTRYLQEILRDVGFLTLACWLLVRPYSRLAVDPGRQHHEPDELDEPDEPDEPEPARSSEPYDGERSESAAP